MKPPPALLEKWLPLALRWVLGGVFLWAGALKIVEPGQFATAIANYRMLPHELINLVAITLPWVEMTAGLLVLAGVWARASALVLTVLTAVFSVALISALARGLNIECGCFGTVGGRHVGLTSLAMDAGLFSFGGWLMWRAKD